MKKHAIISGLFCALAAGAVGCSTSGPDPSTGTEHTGVAEERVIGVDGLAGFTAWPMGPIAFNAGVATMPIAIWSATPIGMLAFDIPGITGLTATIGTLDASGAFIGMPGVTAIPITTPLLTGIQAGLTPFVSPIGLTAASPLIPGAAVAAPLLSPIVPTAGFLAPTITANALMFTGLPATLPLQPLVINLGFTWPAGLNISAVNTFAVSQSVMTSFMASTAASTSLAFTNMLFPLNFIAPVGTLPGTLIF